MIKVLELFRGTGNLSRYFRQRGHSTLTVDWDITIEGIDLYADIGSLTAADIIERFGHPDVIWASPDCTTYSVARIGKHRRLNPITKNLDPISEYAKFCDEVNQHVLALIDELHPTYWFIENPRGGLRKMKWMSELPRYTVTYCKYGEKRMKPTDIWTNHPDPQFIPPCKNGDPCHERAPRGSRTGTQGMKTKREKAKIPDKLCEHIVDICERGMNNE